jgi:molybdopterin-guanine dinucleotide biosynthesis protein A
MDVSAVILAGGQGRRMGGRNKALLTIGPELFIDRQIRVCSDWTDDVVIVSNDGVFAEELKERHHVTVVADSYVGEGPLAGLHAGLMAASQPNVWVLACDQPFLQPAAASLLHERLKRDNTMAALPVLGGRPQPLHAVYRKEAALSAATWLGQGERRLLTLLDHISWSGITQEEFLRAGIPAFFAEDVDTPEDYDRVRRIRT